jgi:hypothetical protein
VRHRRWTLQAAGVRPGSCRWRSWVSSGHGTAASRGGVDERGLVDPCRRLQLARRGPARHAGKRMDERHSSKEAAVCKGERWMAKPRPRSG